MSELSVWELICVYFQYDTQHIAGLLWLHVNVLHLTRCGADLQVAHSCVPDADVPARSAFRYRDTRAYLAPKAEHSVRYAGWNHDPNGNIIPLLQFKSPATGMYALPCVRFGELFASTDLPESER